MLTSNRKGSEVFSIFGQIEAVAAEIMIEKGEIVRIPANEIPASVAVNDEGTPARFAVIVPRSRVYAFNELCANLRA